jgi:ABC-type sugar transport system substrate-binding protein
VESVNRCLRGERPDGVLIILAGGHWTREPFERLTKAGVPVVLLNRVPAWVEDLRRDHPAALVAAVAPDQEGIGEIHARQALRLVSPGSFVLLVTGDPGSQAAVSRRDRFLAAVGSTLEVREVDGRWSVAGAEKALGEWFRSGAARGRSPALVVCQNDEMAVGARSALARHAAASGNAALLRTPLVGCDGTEELGKPMVDRRELAATVVMPPTTPAALQLLERYWRSGATAGTVLLDAASYPHVETLNRVS